MTGLEVWKEIDGYEGRYQVSQTGKVKSTYKGKESILKNYIGKKGYPVVTLFLNGAQKLFKVHRLVAAAFVCGYFEGAEVNHKDAVKTNNNYSNLEWCTNKQNIDHAIKLGLHTAYGEAQWCCKLKTEDIFKIRDLRSKGKTYVAIANMVGVGESQIRNIIWRRSWKHI